MFPIKYKFSQESDPNTIPFIISPSSKRRDNSAEAKAIAFIISIITK